VAEGPGRKPLEVVGPDLIGCGGGVAGECSGAAIGEPVVGGVGVQESMKEHVFMVATEEDVLVTGSVEVDKALDDGAAIRAAVDVVANKDKPVR
jgi:hypothetical protein